MIMQLRPIARESAPFERTSAPKPQPQAARPTPAGARESHELYTRQVTAAVLRRESARCERTGGAFSLIVFEPCRSRKERKQLAAILVDRARGTDEVGWYDHRRLCAILPDTNPTGAGEFVRGVAARAAAAGLDARPAVYSYPTDPLAAAAPLAPLLVKPMPFWKRLTDVVVSGAALAVLSPVLLAVAVLVKLSGPGPVVFKQKRAGLGGRPFMIYKFRTMVPDAERSRPPSAP